MLQLLRVPIYTRVTVPCFHTDLCLGLNLNMIIVKLELNSSNKITLLCSVVPWSQITNIYIFFLHLL